MAVAKSEGLHRTCSVLVRYFRIRKARRWLNTGGCKQPSCHSPNPTVHDAPHYRLRLPRSGLLKLTGDQNATASKTVPYLVPSINRHLPTPYTIRTNFCSSTYTYSTLSSPPSHRKSPFRCRHGHARAKTRLRVLEECTTAPCVALQ